MNRGHDPQKRQLHVPLACITSHRWIFKMNHRVMYTKVGCQFSICAIRQRLEKFPCINCCQLCVEVGIRPTKCIRTVSNEYYHKRQRSLTQLFGIRLSCENINFSHEITSTNSVEMVGSEQFKHDAHVST
jgi:hypothetical protein